MSFEKLVYILLISLSLSCVGKIDVVPSSEHKTLPPAEENNSLPPAEENSSLPHSHKKAGDMLFAIVYANKDRIIAKLAVGDTWPGKMFKEKLSNEAAKDQALQGIAQELNSIYGTKCQSGVGSKCSLEEIASLDFELGKVLVLNCPECQGSNSPGDRVNGIYHIAPWDDAVEVGTNPGNEHIGKYEQETHQVLKAIQQSPKTIDLLRKKGFTWGV